MLKGKTALVIGSTSGIGLGIATRLAAGGANIVLNGFGDAAEIGRLRRELATKHRVSVAYDGADMSRPESISSMMQKALAEFGADELLVNNAGIQHVAPVDDFPVAGSRGPRRSACCSIVTAGGAWAPGLARAF